MDQAIHIKELVKRYDQVLALDRVSLDVEPGELFGLIGPDGAGKTSIIRILTTLILADAGEASVLGYDVVKDYKVIRNIMGYMPGRFSLYHDLSVLENLSLFASVHQTTVEENYHLIKDIYSHIEPFKHRKAGQLSGGMKQKLALSCALIHEPKILFLDEPTTGVDPVSRNEFWEMLKKLQQRGITIFVSTPYMDEANQCDRISLIQNGKIMQVDTPSKVVNAFTVPLYRVKSTDRYLLLQNLKNYPNAASVYAFGEYVHYTDNREDFHENELLQYLREKGNRDVEVEKEQPGIEDCFMALMRENKYE